MEFEYSTQGDPTVGYIVGGIVTVVMIISLWRIFSKAGVPGIFSIIPLVNIYQLVKISGKNPWLFLLLLVPIVNIVVYIIVALGLAKNFGKSGVFGFFGLVVFNLIGYLILAFGGAKYVGGDKA